MIFVNTEQIVDAIGGLERFAHDCHACSLAIVRTGILPNARVARGWHNDIRSQHSWVVVGDPYDRDSTIVDGTLWSYTDMLPGIAVQDNDFTEYRPHGFGMIDPRFRPPFPTGPTLQVTGLSAEAQAFLERIAPLGLDVRGWMSLVNGNMGGWPSKEIISVLADDDRFKGLIPIDIIGMLTDKNPGGLYF